MKVAFVIESFSTKSGSKTALVIAKLLADKLSIEIFGFDTNLDPETLIELNGLGITTHVFSNANKLTSLMKLWLMLLTKDFQLISFHGTWKSFLSCQLSGKKILKTYYGTQFNAYLENRLPNQPVSILDYLINQIFNLPIWLVEKWQFLFSNKIVAISKYCQDEALILYGQKIPFIYLGTNLPVLQKPHGRDNNVTLNFIAVSRITPYKGFHLLIQAVKQMEKELSLPINLSIVGSSPNKPYLKYLKSLATPRTKFFIELNESELNRCYQQADIFLSADRHLFFGLPILEAASYGKPSVVMNYCAASELVQDKIDGFVANNFEEFQDRLSELIKEPSLREKMGRAAFKKAALFSWQKTADGYLKLFKHA